MIGIEGAGVGDPFGEARNHQGPGEEVGDVLFGSGWSCFFEGLRVLPVLPDFLQVIDFMVALTGIESDEQQSSTCHTC